MASSKQATTPLTPASAKRRVDAIAPRLEQRIWPPMTYMLIPSVLQSADTLLAALRSAYAADPDPRLKTELDRLARLRADFRRDA